MLLIYSWQTAVSEALNKLNPFVSQNKLKFQLRVHTLRFETATWNQINSPTCDLCDTNDVQDEQHDLFHCANPHVISLRTKYAFLLPQQGEAAQEMLPYRGSCSRDVYFLEKEQ